MMHVVVAGTGTVGEQVALALVGAGNTVAVVEADPGRAADLAGSGFSVIAGDAGVAETLEAAGGLRADVLVACTGNDDDNLVISLLARHRLEVPRVVARVNDESHRWLFDESWGVDAAISSAGALVSLIEEATGSARTVRLADLSAVGLIVVEASVTGVSAALGLAVAELALAPGDLVAAVVRHGRAKPVADVGRLRSGDRVLVVTGPGGEQRVHNAFYPDEQGSTADHQTTGT
jgi:trk system potassium uptake protein TrkA